MEVLESRAWVADRKIRLVQSYVVSEDVDAFLDAVNLFERIEIREVAFRWASFGILDVFVCD